MVAIPKSEFVERVRRIQARLEEERLDALMVYGDEYRKENLRYVSNFWPIFERGACFIPRKGAPILAGAPEGEKYAHALEGTHRTAEALQVWENCVQRFPDDAAGKMNLDRCRASLAAGK